MLRCPECKEQRDEHVPVDIETEHKPLMDTIYASCKKCGWKATYGPF